MSFSATRRLRAVPAACALAALACAFPAATHAAAPTSIRATGLEVPAGAIADPAGRLWVSDHTGGFCRLTDSGLDADTCLGGALAAKPGPDAAGQPAFYDPTPAAVSSGDELAFVPDGAAASSDVDVLRWDAASGLFSLKGTISMIGTRMRPTAASVGPDGNLYVAFKAAPAGDIQRVRALASDAPVVEVVGHSDGAATLAAGYDAAGALTVYTGEAAGIMQLHPDAATQPSTTSTTLDVGTIGNPPAPRGIGALLYDLDAHALYVGTADAAHLGTGIDAVERFDTATGAAEPDYATALTAVGGLGLDAAGNLLIADAPSPNPGQGRVLLARDVVAPATPSITGVADGSTVDGSPAIGFSSATDARPRWECSLDSGAWAACAPGHPFTWGEDGAHTLQVRATDRAGNVSAPSSTVRFTVRIPVRPAIVGPVAVLPVTKPVVAATPVRPLALQSLRVRGLHARRGVSYALHLAPGTRFVRLRLYLGHRVVASAVRRANGVERLRGGLVAKRALRAGPYRFEVAPAATAGRYGTVTTRAVTLR